MFVSIRKLSTAMGVVAVMAMSTSAQANHIDGSLALAGLGVSQNGANLGISTLINAAATTVSSNGLGDYAPVLIGEAFSGHSIDLSSLTGNSIDNFASLALSSPNVGTFAPTSATIVQRNNSFLDIFVLGVFTPIVPGLMDTLDATDSSLRISINQSGQSLSQAITWNSPPARIPEPATMALAGIAALGFIRYRRRRS